MGKERLMERGLRLKMRTTLSETGLWSTGRLDWRWCLFLLFSSFVSRKGKEKDSIFKRG